MLRLSPIISKEQTVYYFLMVCNKIIGKFELYQTLCYMDMAELLTVIICQDSSSPLL